jgi:hypothetical protein
LVKEYINIWLQVRAQTNKDVMNIIWFGRLFAHRPKKEGIKTCNQTVKSVQRWNSKNRLFLSHESCRALSHAKGSDFTGIQCEKAAVDVCQLLCWCPLYLSKCPSPHAKSIVKFAVPSSAQLFCAVLHEYESECDSPNGILCSWTCREGEVM